MIREHKVVGWSLLMVLALLLMMLFLTGCGFGTRTEKCDRACQEAFIERRGR